MVVAHTHLRILEYSAANTNFSPACNLVIYDLPKRMESLKRNGNMNLLRKRFPAGTYVIRTMLEGKVIDTRKRLIER